jgi:hypothetical protein
VSKIFWHDTLQKIRFYVLVLAGLFILSCNKLPYEYKADKFTDSDIYAEEPVVFKKRYNGMFLLYCPIFHGMSFSSNHNVIGLYSKNNVLIDEIEIGSIPLTLKSWDEDCIILEVINKKNIEYNKFWLKDKNKIGPFKLSFIYHQM